MKENAAEGSSGAGVSSTVPDHSAGNVDTSIWVSAGVALLRVRGITE
jgi:hypothetical protein